jgi:hypothetical protein
MKPVDSPSRFRDRWRIQRALSMVASIPEPKRAAMLDLLLDGIGIPAKVLTEHSRGVVINITNSRVKIVYRQERAPEEVQS